MKISKISALFF